MIVIDGFSVYGSVTVIANLQRGEIYIIIAGFPLTVATEEYHG
jgi:hypothetical protein